jgi:WD40 repeat protein
MFIGAPFDANLVELDPKFRTVQSFKATPGETIRATGISPDGKWALMAGGGRNDPWGMGQSQYEPAKDCDVRIVSLLKDFNPAIYVPNDPRLAEAVGGVSQASQGSRLFTFYHDGSLVWWDAESGRELARTKWETSAMLASMSATGERLAVAGQGGTVTGFDGFRSVGTVRVAAPDFQALAVATGPDAGSVFVGGWRRAVPQGKPAGRAMALEIEVYQYALKDGRLIRTFKGPVGAVTALGVSPDGRTVVALCSNYYGGETAALAWDVASGRELWRWTPLAEPQTKCLLRPLTIDDAGRAAAFVFQTKAVVLDMTSGQVISELLGNAPDAKILAFDPDQKRIWTVARWDVRSWDRATGKQLTQTKTPMKSDQWALRFVPGGRHLLIEALGKKLIEQELDP